MGKLLEELQEYFSNATTEQLEKDWKELEPFSHIGPEAKEFVDPKMMQRHNLAFCWLHGGPKDCSGYLHKISFRLYDENGNELTDENRSTAKIHFKCKCEKCGHETFLTYDPDMPTIIY